MAKYHDSVWRYRLDQNFAFADPLLKGIEFANDWVLISDGEIVISKGYAWDGCSPAYYVPFFGWVGPPDGEINADGVPQAYYASLVHDALCQFRHVIPVSKQTSVRLFKQMLISGGFTVALANVYAKAVSLFGPQDWLG